MRSISGIGIDKIASQTGPPVAVWRDLLLAALAASLTLGVWASVYASFGDSSRLDSGFATYLGGVLAISGLLFRQYMLNEVLSYLNSWERMSGVLEIIIKEAIKRGRTEDSHVKEFEAQRRQAIGYSKYVRRELMLVPVVPVVLIFLYGCAILSEKSLMVREACLFLMVLFVGYLAIAAVTSTRLACAYPDLEKTIADLENLRRDLESSSC